MKTLLLAIVAMGIFAGCASTNHEHVAACCKEGADCCKTENACCKKS